MIRQLYESDMERILDIERKAFIPSIQTAEETIRRRLSKGHTYLGIDVMGELVGTLALRFACFVPDFTDFCRRNPAFCEYAESDNEKEPNAVFVYSLGIIPQYRNGTNAKKLIRSAFDIAKQKGVDFLVGDARIPSYNGSNNLPYEHFERNDTLRRAVDEYFRTGILPPRELIEQDPVAGFYLRIFPEGEILGITDERFWEGDEPCGGHMVIEYLELRK